jgi:putative phosphoribosyl transferase
MEAVPDASRMLKDRADAGRRLAHRLEKYRGENPVVIGTHRGATPVAFEVARALGARLDVLVVRELLAPDARGKVMGAVAEENITIIDEVRATSTEHSRSVFSSEIARLTRELEKAASKYRHDQPPLDLRGRTVILVASGLTHSLAMRAVIDAVRVRGSHRMVAAIAVCSRSTAQEIRRHSDEVIEAIVLRMPEFFLSVAEWYQSYPPLTEEEVMNLLRTAGAFRTPTGASPPGS